MGNYNWTLAIAYKSLWAKWHLWPQGSSWGAMQCMRKGDPERGRWFSREVVTSWWSFLGCTGQSPGPQATWGVFYSEAGILFYGCLFFFLELFFFFFKFLGGWEEVLSLPRNQQKGSRMCDSKVAYLPDGQNVSQARGLGIWVLCPPSLESSGEVCGFESTLHCSLAVRANASSL